MKFYKPKSAVVRFLHIALPMIALILLILAFVLSEFDTYEIARYYDLIGDAVEHILMAILITVGGGVVLDITIKERER